MLHALERLSLIPLVGGSLFLLFTGVVNIDYWYSPMAFSFTTAHFWTAWLVVGALVIHIGAKAATVRDGARSAPHAVAPTDRGAAQDAAVLPETTPGDTRAAAGSDDEASSARSWAPRDCWWWPPSARPSPRCAACAVLAPRNPTVGPQHVPVNQTAIQAGVTGAAVDPDYRLTVTGRCGRPSRSRWPSCRRSRNATSALPITCVEGWSADAVWRGVPSDRCSRSPRRRGALRCGSNHSRTSTVSTRPRWWTANTPTTPTRCWPWN